jgi:hypothetical protein
LRTIESAAYKETHMAQYAMLIYLRRSDGTEPTDANDASATDDRSEHDRHARQLEDSGAMVAAFALKPSATATSIRRDLVTDGPFLEAKEVIAGFAILEAPDLDAALAMARTNPAVWQGGGVEVRPVESSEIYARPVA